MSCANFWTVLHFQHFILHWEPWNVANTFSTWRLKPLDNSMSIISISPTISHTLAYIHLIPWNGWFDYHILPILNPYWNWLEGCSSQDGVCVPPKLDSTKQLKWNEIYNASSIRTFASKIGRWFDDGTCFSTGGLGLGHIWSKSWHIYLIIEMLKTIAQSVLRDLAGTLPLNPESRLDADLCWNNDMHQM